MLHERLAAVLPPFEALETIELIFGLGEQVRLEAGPGAEVVELFGGEHGGGHGGELG